MEKEKNKNECYLETLNKSLCTGCGACKESCPQNCIYMVEDKEGFYYPKVDEKKCINCGKCKRVCPTSNELINKDKLEDYKVYAYKSNNDSILLSSSSGGAFSSIVEKFCIGNYAIFGAKFDDNLNVVHDYVIDKKNIEIFKKSKYVQSNMKNNFSKVEEFLKKGSNVLFTGTPCQVAGLKKYLVKEYDKLLCVDIICHGVPSQKVFNIYLKYVSEKYKCRVKAINFREKTLKFNKWNSRNIKLNLENGKNIIKNNIDDPYLRGFHRALFYRPSCYNCKFANENRISDITMADCWGLENIINDADVHKGYSMVILNTLKGKKIFGNEQNEEQLIKLNKQFVVKNNAQFTRSTTLNKNRHMFFDRINSERFDKLVFKCVPILKTKIMISSILPSRLKKVLKCLKHR